MTSTMKLELVAIPVSDVDAAITFYRDAVGFALDHDHVVSDEVRFVQMTPPGSACSIAFGTGISTKEPGSVEGTLLVVDDAEAIRDELRSRGVEASEISEFPWGRFVYFMDPDGNGWQCQQMVPQG